MNDRGRYLFYARDDKIDGGFAALSSREREVLELLAKHNHSKKVADVLGVSDRTIECHRRMITAAFGSVGRALYELGRLHEQQARQASEDDKWCWDDVVVGVL